MPKSLQEAVPIIHEYKEILKGENKKIINIVGKQGQLLKWFKKSDGFVAGISLSRPNICKIPVLKNLTFQWSYFKSNFKLLQSVQWILGKKNSNFEIILLPFITDVACNYLIC